MKPRIKTHPVKAESTGDNRLFALLKDLRPEFALLKDLRPDPQQPRKDFPAAEQAALRESIRASGVQEALVVRADPEKKTRWLIVEGERRWRVAGELKLARVPIAPRAFADEAAVRTYQRIAGTQRLNLSALEEAAALDRELQARQQANPKFSITDLAAAIGKARATTYELLSLLKLPPPVRAALEAGTINPSQATRIALVPGASRQVELLKWLEEEVEYNGVVSVRALEAQVAREYPKDLARAAMEKNGVKFEREKRNLTPRQKAKAGVDKFMEEIREQVAAAVEQRLPAALANKLSSRAVYGFLEKSDWRLQDSIANLAKAHGWPGKLAKLSAGRQRAAVVMAYLDAKELPTHGGKYSAAFQAACQLAGIDLKAEEKKLAAAQARNPAKKPKK